MKPCGVRWYYNGLLLVALWDVAVNGDKLYKVELVYGASTLIQLPQWICDAHLLQPVYLTSHTVMYITGGKRDTGRQFIIM